MNTAPSNLTPPHLKGYPGLESLDAKGWSSLRIGLLLLSLFLTIDLTLLVLALVIAPIPGDMLTPLVTENVLNAINTALVLTALVASIRQIQNTCERDLLPIDAEIANYRSLMVPGKLNWLIAGLIAVLGHGIVSLLTYRETGLNVYRVENLTVSNLPYITTKYIGLLHTTLAFGVALGSMVGTVTYVRTIAQKVPLDLLRIETYACLTVPALWGVYVFGALLAPVGAVAIFTDSTAQQGVLLQVLFTFGLGIGLLIILASWPVWIMRNRIVSAKARETAILASVLRGDRTALAETDIRLPEDASHADVISQWMLIDNLPDWPIGANLQRILIFGLLPPVAWTLAALVENLLF